MKTMIASILFAAAACIPAAADFATEMVEATFKLYHKDSTATCFLVRGEAPDTALYLVTAAHVFERTKGGTAILVLREKMDDGTYQRRDHRIAIRMKDLPLWVRCPGEDTAVLRLADPLPVPVSALPLGALASEKQSADAGLRICSPVFALTYPQRFEANPAGFAVARSATISSHPLFPIEKQHTFIADFTTFAGDSGGPVFVSGADGHPLVIGIVLAQFRHDEVVKTEYEERTIHHPLGLGTVLHSRFVRETIELAAKPAARQTD